MLTPADGAARRFDFKLALALLVIAGTAIYAAVFLDPYIALIMLPFFALGCARGKHPAALVALAAAPVLLLLAGSLVKFQLTGLPLVIYDQHFLRANAVMMVYNDWRIAIAVVITLGAMVFYFAHLLAGRGTFSRFEKWGVVVLGLSTIGCVAGLRTWDKTIQDWENELATPTVKSFVASARMPGATLHLTSTAAAAIPPEPVDPEETKGLTAPVEGLPDLFFVLQESTFPPALIKPGYEPQTLFSSKGLTNTSGYTGPLHVHTFAGGTWRTEFSVTAQLRPQEFGNDGLYVFYQLQDRIKESLFTRLKALGYRTMVFYPVPGHFINAHDFYLSFGVDEFYDPQDLGVSEGWDWKLPDSKLYDAMLKKIGTDGRPVMALMLTINQHGPHAGPDPDSDYLSRFAQSDAAYGDFLKALGQRGRKAGVVTFGDHQPDFLADREDHALWYYTAYDIRCVNFACADRPVTNHESKQIDAVMLAPRALEAFGFGLDGFSALENRTFQGCDDDLNRCSEAARLTVNKAFARFFN